jgi:hypothetical protein
MADVFISYKREERAQIGHLAYALRALNLTVWFDAGLSAGEAFSDEIDKEVREAKAVLVCWSPTARESRWVKAEAEIGFGTDKLVAAYVAGPDGFAAPVPFNTLHAEDLRAWLSSPMESHSGWKSLLRRIGRLCDRQDLESWGALDAQSTAAELREWIQRYPQSPLFVTVDGILREREVQDAERARIEKEARERRSKEEEERRRRKVAEQRHLEEEHLRIAAENERTEKEAQRIAEKRAASASRGKWLLPTLAAMGGALVLVIVLASYRPAVVPSAAIAPPQPTAISNWQPRTVSAQGSSVSAVNEQFLVGRWGDNGDCSKDVVLNADGSFTSYSGGEGRWSLNGSTMRMAGRQSTQELELELIDQNTVRITNPDGSVGTSQRCS